MDWIAANTNELRLVAAFLAAAVASLAILSQRRTTARKTTLDFILNRELHEPEWLQLRLRVYPILNDPARWGKLIQAPSTAEKQDVLTWLNHHEIIAIAINHRALDKRLYFAWFETMYRSDWELARHFVATFRDKQDNAGGAFIEFEQLATAAPLRATLLKDAFTIVDVLLYAGLATLVIVLSVLLLLA